VPTAGAEEGIVLELPEYQTLLVDRDEGVTTITLNRPEKRNALSPQLHREMHDLLTRVEGDDDTRVVVLTGAGPSFSAGQDLKEFFNDLAGDESERRRVSRLAAEWRERLLRMCPKPTIAMVTGYCFGGATAIVSACDFAYAAEDAVFGVPAVNFGNLPGGPVGKSMMEVMAFRDAIYSALTGATFDGRRASEIKFVNAAVPRAELRDTVYRLARKLAGMDAAALRITKEALLQVRDMNQEQAYYWLQTKSNELKWRHEHEGRGGDGVKRFLEKQYRPGLQSFTETE
jgi:trans-feruloyl-CoA hydratase/vanillin synthase